MAADVGATAPEAEEPPTKFRRLDETDDGNVLLPDVLMLEPSEPGGQPMLYSIGYGAPAAVPRLPRMPRKVPRLYRKAPLYDNCQLLSPDGVLLCQCDQKKVDWYVSRGLAEVIETQPATIARLVFEPAGLGRHGDAFYLGPKDNHCVVCGATTALIRHHVVPFEYRKEFPLELKAHKSHDVLLLCVQCQAAVQFVYKKHKEQIAQRYNAPVRGSGARRKKDRVLDKLANFAKLLLTCTDEQLCCSPLFKPGSSDGLGGDERPVDCLTETPVAPAPTTDSLPSSDLLLGSLEPVGSLSPSTDPASITATSPTDVIGESPVTPTTEPESTPTANALKAKRQKERRLPERTIIQMLQFIVDHSELEAVNREALAELQQVDPVIEDPDFVAHGEMVVKQLTSPADFTAFIKDWRQTFVDGMRPRCLPSKWSVHYEEEVFDVAEPKRRKADLSSTTDVATLST